jgi:hypothetical protein
LAYIYDRGILPLNVSLDGAKGTKDWSQPELKAGAPGNAWIHQWGLFVHERQSRVVDGTT